MASFIDPAYHSTTFERILVIANTSDLQLRQKLETRVVESFKNIDVDAIEGFLLFPPTRSLTNDEKIKLLIDNHIDAYISIDVGESGVQDIYVPPTGSTTTTTGRISVSGNQADYKEKSTTTVDGGYTLSKPWAEYQAKLYDVSSGSIAWIASSHTGGNAYANFNTIINSFSDELAKRITEDGMVRQNIINGRSPAGRISPNR
ncbi:MAG: hypothetical protein ACHQQQ_01315 [Bacteroidota bacterium]